MAARRISGELDRLQKQISRIGEEATDEEIWRKVELARHDDRPYTLDYVERLLDDWFELHGDRAIADDGAMIAGLGKLDGRTVVLKVGQQKGHATSTSARARRFGMPESRGVPQGVATRWSSAPTGTVSLSSRSWIRSGAYPGVIAEQQRPGRGDRAVAGDDGPAEGADR